VHAARYYGWAIRLIVARLRPTAPQLRLPDAGARTSPEAPDARATLALVQLAILVLAAVAGALLVAATGLGTGLARAVASAPAWLAVILVAGYAAAAGLTLWITSRLVGRLADGVPRPAGLDRGAATQAERRDGDARSPVLVDWLTGLGNHRAFHEELGRQLESVRRGGTAVAVAVIDLDDFRSLNDGAGHAAGDAMLVEATRIIRQGMRRTDHLFRVGGDEFAAILPGARAEEAAVALQRALADCVKPRIGSAAAGGFSFSAGVTDTPARGLERTELVDQAEQALLESKRGGRTTVRVFDPVQRGPLDEPAMRRASASVVDLVRSASLTPVYQPIVDVASGRVVGFEGLVRPRPGSGFENPGTLFAVAEATGRASDLDRLAVETVLGGAAGLAPDQTLSINLSPCTLESPEFSVTSLVRLVAGSGFEPRRVVLELTERQAITDMETLGRRLRACQAAGFRVAVDDVGAGNAGLRLLSQLHFDRVKIDLSLVQAGARREASLEVVRSLSDLAARWGATAVAEGVETASQLRMVRDLGLTEVQGYLLGVPAPGVELREVDLEALLVDRDARASLGFAPLSVAPLG
jgi:diguanylate cyclase (GGDEF)-like protein